MGPGVLDARADRSLRPRRCTLAAQARRHGDTAQGDGESGGRLPPLPQVDQSAQAVGAEGEPASWMITPASTSPAATAGMMRSNGMTTGSCAPPRRAQQQRRRGQLSRDGDPGPAECPQRGGHPPAVARHAAASPSGDHQRAAPPAQGPAGVQQRVPFSQVSERVDRDLDDICLAARSAVRSACRCPGAALRPRAHRAAGRATQAWKMNVSLGQGE